MSARAFISILLALAIAGVGLICPCQPAAAKVVEKTCCQHDEPPPAEPAHSPACPHCTQQPTIEPHKKAVTATLDLVLSPFQVLDVRTEVSSARRDPVTPSFTAPPIVVRFCCFLN